MPTDMPLMHHFDPKVSSKSSLFKRLVFKAKFFKPKRVEVVAQLIPPGMPKESKRRIGVSTRFSIFKSLTMKAKHFISKKSTTLDFPVTSKKGCDSSTANAQEPSETEKKISCASQAQKKTKKRLGSSRGCQISPSKTRFLLSFFRKKAIKQNLNSAPSTPSKSTRDLIPRSLLMGSMGEYNSMSVSLTSQKFPLKEGSGQSMSDYEEACNVVNANGSLEVLSKATRSTFRKKYFVSECGSFTLDRPESGESTVSTIEVSFELPSHHNAINFEECLARTSSDSTRPDCAAVSQNVSVSSRRLTTIFDAQSDSSISTTATHFAKTIKKSADSPLNQYYWKTE